MAPFRNTAESEQSSYLNILLTI